MNLHIVAIFRLKENYMMDGIELLKKLVIKTRQEAGCLQYDLIEDRENKGTFFIVEIWETAEHHHQHNSSEHLFEFRNNIAIMVECKTEVYKGSKIF